MTIGYEKGEVCNRNNCSGIIEEYDIDGSCSCHVNPPCSYCTTPKEYCPACGWDAKEEQDEEYLNKPNEIIKNIFQPVKYKTIKDLDKTKIDWIIKLHTHFSMICEGVYPPGISIEEIRKKVDGTFGGRFEYCENGIFKFIAYTD